MSWVAWKTRRRTSSAISQLFSEALTVVAGDHLHELSSCFAHASEVCDAVWRLGFQASKQLCASCSALLRCLAGTAGSLKG